MTNKIINLKIFILNQIQDLIYFFSFFSNKANILNQSDKKQSPITRSKFSKNELKTSWYKQSKQTKGSLKNSLKRSLSYNLRSTKRIKN